MTGLWLIVVFGIVFLHAQVVDVTYVRDFIAEQQQQQQAQFFNLIQVLVYTIACVVVEGRP